MIHSVNQIFVSADEVQCTEENIGSNSEYLGFLFHVRFVQYGLAGHKIRIDEGIAG